jgi:hypothetical protein
MLFGRLAGNGVHFGVQNSGSTSDCTACGGFGVVHIEGGSRRVLVAGDVPDGGEVASDRGHVREGRVSEVVGPRSPRSTWAELDWLEATAQRAHELAYLAKAPETQ